MHCRTSRLPDQMHRPRIWFTIYLHLHIFPKSKTRTVDEEQISSRLHASLLLSNPIQHLRSLIRLAGHRCLAADVQHIFETSCCVNKRAVGELQLLVQRTSWAETKAWATLERFKGNEMFKVRDYTQALGRYNRAIQLDPSDAEAYNNRAAVHSQNKDWNSCEADCSRALRLKPE